MSTSTLTSKGQTTIPKDIREHLCLEPGDRIEFLLDEKGRVILVPAKLSLASLAGLLGHRAKHDPVTLEEMDRAVAAGASSVEMAGRPAPGPYGSRGGTASRVTPGDRAAEGAPERKGRNR